MPQRAMVRIWVASLHQKNQRRNYAGFCFARHLKSHSRGWIRTAAATSLKMAQKQPGGLFLAARLATSTRAHQKNQRRNYAGFCFARHLKSHSRGWIRTAAATSLKMAQKQPGGLFLAARLATSTRAHQKTSTYVSTLRFLFCCKARLTGRVGSNSIGPPNSPAGKKAPAGLF